MKLEEMCRILIENKEYEKCEEEIRKAMEENPHSAVPHNLMGILMEKQMKHTQAMKHFRAASDLDPAYMPARYNMEKYGFYSDNFVNSAYDYSDCLKLKGKENEE